MIEKTFKWDHVHNADELEAFYKAALPRIVEAAQRRCYAIAAHGSMRRDLDLIAVPWAGEFATPDELAYDIQEAACGIGSTKYSWEQKPNGRIACAFPICWPEFGDHKIPSLGCIDLSVITVPPKNIDQDHAAFEIWFEREGYNETLHAAYRRIWDVSRHSFYWPQ